MSRAIFNDIDLYFEIHGKGTPLMLIAGLASDCQSWQPVIKDLSHHFLVITPDNRGVGRTTPQNIEISIQQIADDSVALIRHLGFSSVNLLGHSMGGLAALDLVGRYPDCINKLILAGTSPINSRRNNGLFSDWASSLESGMDLELWFRNIFYWIFSRRFFENEATVRDAVQFAIEYPYPQSAIAFRNQVQAIARYDGSKYLSRVHAKTLVLCGKEDLIFPTQETAGLARAIPRADFSVVDNAAHSIHMEQPLSFIDNVLNFLLDH